METPFLTRSGCLHASPVSRLLVVMLLAGGCLEAAQKAQPATKAVAKPAASLLKARWRVLGARPLGLYYHFADARALKSLEAHTSQMTVLGPQSFWVDVDGIVHGQVPPRVLEVGRQAKLPIMPLLINPRFDRPTVSGLLRDPHAQERAAMYLAYLARRDDYVGWQLDLENIDPADRQRYTQFVARVAARLHRGNRLLSVAVVPRFSDASSGADSPGEFPTGVRAAAYDFRALGRLVDFMALMTYNHHGDDTQPGPVAGYDWVKAALDYAVQRVPRAKLLLGIPFYGREWVATSRGTSSRSLAFQEVKGLLDRPEIRARWNDQSRTGWFEYRDDSGLHTAWYEDSKSLNEKLQLMQRYRLRGFAAWRLGMEDARFWGLAVVTPSGSTGSLPRPVGVSPVRGHGQDGRATSPSPPHARKSRNHP